MPEPTNALYYGDNRDVLPRYVASESVDLVYLDPPFNSNADYNVLFAEKDGTQSAAQIKAFTDTWRWDTEAARWYDAAVHSGHGRVAEAMTGFRSILGESDMLAYLANMAPCLIELHRVLKPTGSLYLHCDPTASHYLKLLMDAVFGPTRFGSEIIWKRTSAHSDTRQGRKLHGHIHDVILFYTKRDEWVWNPIYVPYDEEYVEERFAFADADGRTYKDMDLTVARPGGDTQYEWRIKRGGQLALNG